MVPLKKIVRYAYCGYFYDANNEQSVCHKYNPKIKDILEKTIDAFEVRTKEQKQFEEPKSRMRLMFFYEYMQLWWLHNDAEMSFFTCVKKVKEALREEQYSFALKTAEISKMRKRCQLVFKLCKMHMATIACLIFRILHW